MIYGFYFRFYKWTHSKTISVILSRVAYLAYLCSFLLKRLFIKKRIVTMTREQACELLESVYPDPGKKPEYNNPKIVPGLDLSVVIPVYNHVDNIQHLIDAVLQQKTNYTYELILVDDGSTDGARDVVRSYGHCQNVKAILQKNTGIAGARNAGIDQAQGRYLMFIDCDDDIHDDLIDVLLKRAYKDDCDIAMCAHNLVKERDGKAYCIIPNVLFTDANLLNYKNHDEIMNYPGLPWAKVYKRELWNRVRFFPGYWYEDTIIQFLLFTQCRKFSYETSVCYEYRWNDSNFSHIQGGGAKIKTTDRYWGLQAIIDHYCEMGLPVDGQFYTLLLRHVSAYYYKTIKDLEPQLVDALFILACGLAERYRPKDKCRLPFVLNKTERALRTRDIELWKLTCRYQ